MHRAKRRNRAIPQKPRSAPIEIAATAEAQRGLVTRAQLIAAGIPDSTIRGWADRGHLHAVHRAVYAIGHRRRDMETAWLAATMAAGPGAAISRRSSGELQHLLAVDELHWHRSRIHLTRPGRPARRDGLIIHSAPLASIDVVEVRGIRATAAARTLFDIAPRSTAAALRRAFEEAEYLELLDRDRLAALCESGRGHRNIAELRRLLDEAPLPLAELRSRLEALLLRTCRDNSLPLPATNVPVLGYEADFLWKRERFVVEADGGRHRGRRRDLDNRRDADLARAGYLTRRYSGAALQRSDDVAREVRAILAERSPG
jgi:very-short-patch-repair endonuclease